MHEIVLSVRVEFHFFISYEESEEIGRKLKESRAQKREDLFKSFQKLLKNQLSACKLDHNKKRGKSSGDISSISQNSFNSGGCL